MAALTAARDTKRKLSSVDMVQEYPMAVSTTIYRGSIVMLDAGVAKPGATATGKFVVGRAMETKTSAATGTSYIKVETGIFKYANSGTDAVDANDVGAACFLEDDQTVAETNGTNTRSACGIVEAVDSDGVWVLILNGARQT